MRGMAQQVRTQAGGIKHGRKRERVGFSQEFSVEYVGASYARLHIFHVEAWAASRSGKWPGKMALRFCLSLCHLRSRALSPSTSLYLSVRFLLLPYIYLRRSTLPAALLSLNVGARFTSACCPRISPILIGHRVVLMNHFRHILYPALPPRLPFLVFFVVCQFVQASSQALTIMERLSETHLAEGSRGMESLRVTTFLVLHVCALATSCPFRCFVLFLLEGDIASLLYLLFGFMFSYTEPTFRGEKGSIPSLFRDRSTWA